MLERGQAGSACPFFLLFSLRHGAVDRPSREPARPLAGTSAPQRARAGGSGGAGVPGGAAVEPGSAQQPRPLAASAGPTPRVGACLPQTGAATAFPAVALDERGHRVPL